MASFYERDRGFMDSLYLKDPNGLTVELACYKFQTPEDSAMPTCLYGRIASGREGSSHCGKSTWRMRSRC